MKDFMKMLGLGFVGGLGYAAGFYLWENILEDKVSDLKDRLNESKSQE